MDERVLQFRVGVMVLASALATGILTMFFGELPSLVSGNYTIYIEFSEAPGVQIDTPVRKSGVLIGRVSKVTLKDSGEVLVTAELNSQFKLHSNEVCRISSGSLLGDAILEFIPSAEQADPKALVEDGAYMKGLVSSNPLDVLVNLEGSMNSAMDSVKNAGDEVGQLAKRLNGFMGTNEDRLGNIMLKAETALGSFDLAMTAINDVIGDKQIKERLKKALEDVPNLLVDARKTLASLERMSALAEKNLMNLEGFTKPLRERGDQIVANVDASVETLSQVLDELVSLTQAINRNEGTLGKLIHDPDLYIKLEKSANNIETATRRLTPIVKNLNVFTDKIARDPSRISEGIIRGAVRRPRAPIK